MRLVFAGTPAVAAATLAYLLDHSGHEVIAVVTRPDAPRGRSRRPVPSPVAQAALERDLEVLRPTTPSEPAFGDRLRALAPDCCPVVAYGALVPAPVLVIPRLGWLNVHYSLLPRWRGAAPVQRAILAGDQVTGVSVFGLVAALDAGPVFAAEPYQIGAEQTAGEVLAALEPLGAQLLCRVLDDLESGRAAATGQPIEGVTLAPKLAVAEARIDWGRSSTTVAALVRACNPAPMAWTLLGGERFRVNRARSAPSHGLSPGEVAVTRAAVLVGTGDGDLELIEVQPQGRRAMPAADWGRGLRRDAHFDT